MRQPPLIGKTALVSGALGDIGRAIAVALAEAGASVAVSDLAPGESSGSILGLLRPHGQACRYDRVDVADGSAVQAWVDAVASDLGTASLIVPNAAVVTQRSATQITAEAWRRELSINLDGAFYLARAAALRLQAQALPGRIVFIGSWAAHRPHTNIAAYCVAKSGLRMLMRLLALELAPSDILVNEVAPGFVDAGLSASVWRERPEARERAIQQVPIGRLITPEDVANEVLHLCMPQTRHTTGSVALIDGGLSLLAGESRGD